MTGSVVDSPRVGVSRHRTMDRYGQSRQSVALMIRQYGLFIEVDDIDVPKLIEDLLDAASWLKAAET